MRTIKVILLLILISMAAKISAQSVETQQLLLNVEKLAQLKQILADLKKGYQIVSAGYNSIKSISEGNFNLHKVFLDGLMDVSPTIKKYRRVGDIINSQMTLVKEYKNAYKLFRLDNHFNDDEIEYMGKVYANLFDQSLKELDVLAIVITANKLRMSDDERLKAVDDIFASMLDKLNFLRDFNNNASILAIERAHEKNDANRVVKIYGLTN